MPVVESERLSKEAAGPGLTSTLLPRNLEETAARRNSENILRISRARTGRRPVRLETRWPGRADVAWDWNLTDRPGRAWARDFENITRWAGRGLGQAPSARPGSTPPPRVGPPAKIVGFEILDFLEFENISRNVT